ncbi:MAG TPA: restriction endonuclease [Fibrobacteraceae bacterium]|nr:restriction endonuclease [Fibrobacteraceae bacterium]
MAIPNFQDLLLPVLRLHSDGNERAGKTLIPEICQTFQLTEEERVALLPSGRQRVIANRIAWAHIYLKKAGLLESHKRGMYRISERGQQALKENLEKIDVAYLSKYPEFNEFRFKKDPADPKDTDSDDVQPDQTPEEILEKAYKKIRDNLASEILEKVHSQTPAFFERLVIELLVAMGYGGSFKEAGMAIGKTNDEGIDGVIKEDKLGLDIIYVQAKRWDMGTTIGRPEIQKFVGALAGQGAKKGIFITTARFSREAMEYTPKNETKVVLIDGNKLADLLVEYDIGVSKVIRYDVKKIDNDYFEEADS